MFLSGLTSNLRPGHEGVVFVSGLSLSENLPQMALLSRRLTEEPSVQRVDSWYDEFQFYVNYNQYGGTACGL